MKMTWINDLGGSKYSRCEVRHGDEVLEFAISHYKRVGSQRKEAAGDTSAEDQPQEASAMIFHYHNQWFETYLSPQQCDFLFNQYKKARELFNNPKSHTEMVMELRKIVVAIVDYVPFTEVHHFIMFNTDIRTPASVQDTFDEGPTGRNRRDKTYTKPEYQKLVTLTFIIRLLAPIWGEMLEQMKTYVKNAKMELTAFELMFQSELMQSEAMQRLINFINNTIPNDADKSPALIEGIASVEYNDWIASIVVLRRLIAGQLQDGEDTTSLVSFIYRYIIQQARNNKFGGYIKDKNPQKTSSARDDSNEISTWEAYRVKARWVPGDVVYLEHYLSDPIRVYEDLMGGMPEDLIEAYRPQKPTEEFARLMSEPIGQGQRILLQYVVSLIGTHRLVPELSRWPIYSAMIASVKFLSAINQHEIAALMTSIPYQHIGIAGTNSRHRKNLELQLQIKEHYPWPRKTQSKQSSVDTKLPHERAIERIEPHFNKSHWWLTVDDDILSEINQPSKNGRIYTTGADFKQTLTGYFLAIEKRRRELKAYRDNKLKDLLAA